MPVLFVLTGDPRFSCMHWIFPDAVDLSILQQITFTGCLRHNFVDPNMFCRRQPTEAVFARFKKS